MRDEKQAQRQSGKEEEEEQLSGILILELINNNSINAITISPERCLECNDSENNS